jgi:fumarylacetoacetase
MSFPVDETHDPSRTSWVESANGHADFPVQNLPLGVFSPPAGDPRIGTAIGDYILDLRAASQAGLLPETVAEALAKPTLNALFDTPKEDRLALRRRLSALLSDPSNRGGVEPLLHAAQGCALHLPAAIGDYTDFYVGIHHATNVGRLFRPDNPLLPNYKYVPIGYHGRSSSICVSGTSIHRPNGQRKAPTEEAPTFGPSRRLDYELEIGIWMGPGNELGAPVPIRDAWDHVSGVCLLNDWSARDIQAWEYVPLGPFLAKNFQSTISSWVVTSEALAPFRIAQPPRPPEDPRPLDYLWSDADQTGGALGIDMTVSLLTQRMRDAGQPPYRLSQGPASNMYWTVAQIVAHHTSNGCNLNPGDLLGTGTISGPQRDGYGSLLEISRGGAEPLVLPNGETRTFVEDGDEVIMTGRAQAEGRVSIGFGPCRAVVLPAR